MRRVSPTLLLFCAAVVVSLACAELVLRVRIGSPVPFRYPQPRYVSDPGVGHWLEPEQRSFNLDTPLRVNRVGIRGGEHPREVPLGARRVLALGDSQTFGNGLRLADTWPGQLERELNQRTGGVEWEVLNAGLSGTDTWQHERILERLSGAYEVDEIVLGFYVNDVAPVYQTVRADLRTNTRWKRTAYLLKRSALVRAVWQSFRRVLLPDGGLIREGRILTGEYDPSVEAGWEQVEASLRSMKQRADSLDARFTLLVIPRRDQVSGDEPAMAYNQRIAAIGARLGVPVVDVLGPLRRAYADRGDELFIPWDGHNSALANAVIAEELAGRLRSR